MTAALPNCGAFQIGRNLPAVLADLFDIFDHRRARRRDGSRTSIDAESQTARGEAHTFRYARDPASLPKIEKPRSYSNGTAIVELLKVLLRMTSERHAVASKVIATVDDLEQIAADDNADVGALHGWRRELFGEAALALKHGRLALAIEKGRVVKVERS